MSIDNLKIKSLFDGIKSTVDTINDFKDAVLYLRQYYMAYINEDGSVNWKNVDEISVGDIKEALEKFQELFGLKQDGVLGPKTYRAMMTPRCGFPDRFVASEARGYKWRKRNLTFYIDKYLSEFSKEQMRKSVDYAFSLWEQHTNINIVETNAASKADMVISTGRGRRHGFDGAGGTLAWAYLPNGSDSQLLSRFDEDETWTIDRTQRGIYVIAVGAHEFGHLLGLDHSKKSGALMAPYYNPSIWEPQQNDDVTRIQALYGKRVAPPVEPPADDDNNDVDNKVVITVEGEIEKISIPGYRINKMG